VAAMAAMPSTAPIAPPRRTPAPPSFQAQQRALTLFSNLKLPSTLVIKFPVVYALHKQ